MPENKISVPTCSSCLFKGESLDGNIFLNAYNNGVEQNDREINKIKLEINQCQNYST